MTRLSNKKRSAAAASENAKKGFQYEETQVIFCRKFIIYKYLKNSTFFHKTELHKKRNLC